MERGRAHMQALLRVHSGTKKGEEKNIVDRYSLERAGQLQRDRGKGRESYDVQTWVNWYYLDRVC